MDRREFVLTEDHVKLLRRMSVSWDYCEFGAPRIDPKRPYGNSWVYGDIADILNIDPAEGEEFSCAQEEAMQLLHYGTQTALQIMLVTGSCIPGRYVADQYKNNWELQ